MKFGVFPPKGETEMLSIKNISMTLAALVQAVMAISMPSRAQEFQKSISWSHRICNKAIDPILADGNREIALENRKSAVEADLAAVFDVRNCGLKCFDYG